MIFDFESMLYVIPALLIALPIHEYAHARMAYYFGDPTAKMQGRMTLNPISHLDPIGTLMILIARFGWAKPVPINPYNFRNYRKGLLWVSFAGPMANFITAFVALFIFRIIYYDLGLITFASIPYMILFFIVQLNLILGVFNLIPIPPLDGSKILLSLAPSNVAGFIRQIEPYAPILLIVLIVSGGFRMIIFPITNAILDFYHMIIGFNMFFGF